MITIGNFTIQGKIALSPMAGISDSPHRFLTRKMGAAFSYTEFVSSDGINHYSRKCIDLFKYQEKERPIIFQIFGNNKQILTNAAKIIEELEPDAIDLNMGCSTQKVSQRGSGAGLLKNPLYAGEILESMVKAVKVPVTAKIRIGWDENSLNYKEIAHIVQESGCQMLSVHGRTKVMGYTGLADWNIIGEVKSIVKIPVWGNGDIQSYEEGMQRIRQTGVDGVLVGRAAIGNPWIFSGKNKKYISKEEFRNVVHEHFRLMQEFYGETQGLILFRKHLSKYCNGLKNFDDYKKVLLTTENTEIFLENLDNLLNTGFEIGNNSNVNENLHCESFV